ncbi:MAG: MBL fold metallo-hydrolase [Clostridiales bacterium]|nr:MBL fold metallo-hydrolase [Clostridiales bacterium]
MLKFLGTGSAFNAEMGNNAAYIKENDKLLLIDCGETVFARIKEMGLVNDVNHVYIIITHNHSDHIGSLGTLIPYLAITKNITTNLIIANDESGEEQEKKLREYLTKLDVDEEYYDTTYADMMEDVFNGLEKIELVKVKHSKTLTCYAAELYFKDRVIYYTGDQNDISYLKKIAKKLKKNDLVYTDCTALDYKNRIHINFTELEEVFDESIREQVYCMHFENYKTYSHAKELGFKVANKELSKEELLKQIANRK